MNRTDTDSLRRRLADGGRQLGIDLGLEQQEALMAYLEALQQWNRAYNLTAVKDARQIICRHFLDSFSFFPFLADRPGPVLDLGTGAGFPGLPLALLLPTLPFLLVDARQKKTLFLQHVVRLLGLDNVEIHHLHLRRGNGSTELIKPAAALVSRAVSVKDEVFPVAGDLLAPGGLLLLSATASSRGEIVEELAFHESLQLGDITPVVIPFLEQERYMVRITRV